jgi:hypothetical protein
MSDYINAFEDLLVQIRRRGFKTDSVYINYLFQDLQDHPIRANSMFNYYGVIR